VVTGRQSVQSAPIDATVVISALVEGAQTQYAKSGDRYIGYQVLGDGPIDLLALNNGNNIWIDRDDEPHWARFDRRLASFTRLIRFDPSGVGLSDPLAGGELPTVELWTHDAVAVLDAVESKRTALLGVSTGGAVAMVLSAMYPERISALVLMHSWARLARDDDYPCGVPQHVLDRWVNTVSDPTRGDDRVDDLALMAPSLAGDPEFQRWWSNAGERSAGPMISKAMDTLATAFDVRGVLPLINVPTLVLHRVDNASVRVGHAHYLAEHISGAKLVELPGRDHLANVGETEPVLDEVEEFLTGTRGGSDTERVLATILFSDIVDSTRRASMAGDRLWREQLDNHDRMADRQVQRFGGTRVKSTGDGLLATFDGPARAIQCGLAICDGARQLGMEVRVGVHTGEVERRGADISGIGVHIAARVQACAEPGEVWVSRTLTDLLTGSGVSFADRGEHTLRGVPGTWQLFMVEG
jgi:class 3 adenylate cyclase